MHRTLERQLRKLLPGVDVGNPAWQNFLKAVDETYQHFDKDRRLVTRSLELSSKELVEVNERIAKEKAKDEIILASIADALVITDAAGKIALLNRSAEALLGHSTADARDQTFEDLFQEITDEKGALLAPEQQPVNQVLAGQKKVRLISQITKKDGDELIVSIMASPYIFDQKIAGVACIIRDITKEQAIDQAKSEFVSLASHQLRTPLSTVGWYTEMLLAGDAGLVNDQQKSYLEEIYAANHRMVDLVNALLNVSRIELGTFMLTPEPVSLVETAKSVVKELQPQISQKALVVQENYDPTVPIIAADAKLVRIIFQNLLTNAVKYTPGQGRVGVKLSLASGEQIRRGDPSEQYIMLSVADTGYGIPKKQRDKVFTKLFRADNVREKETDGTGLGLYLVKSILEACSGFVWFESTENKGSTFYVAIPKSGMKAKQGTKTLI